MPVVGRFRFYFIRLEVRHLEARFVRLSVQIRKHT
jgi:hypothetical protein